MKINESNITIMVKNMDKTISFYKMLGLKLKKRWENYYAILAAPGVVIGLHSSDSKPKGSGDASIGFMIDNIRADEKLLTKNKEKYKFDEGGSGSHVHFKDPNGTILYFTQPKWNY